jgi:kynurenine aminotransferase
MNGGKIVYVPIRPPAAEHTHSASEWKLDPAELESKCGPKTKMIVLNTPHNPLGKMFSKEELEEIGRIAIKHDLIIVSDEVYDRLDYEPHHRIATLSPELSSRTITVGSAGKTFGCTGWRIGWLIGEPHLIKYAAAANTRVVFSCVSPLQEAVAVAFEQAEEHGYYDKTVAAYQERMKTLNKVWDELGLPVCLSISFGGSNGSTPSLKADIL